MLKTIVGVFKNRDDAEQAINKLDIEGFKARDISIIMKDRAIGTEMTKETGASSVAEGAVSGATTGAVVGGLAGLLTAFAIPGLGAFLIGGPVITALGLSGAAATTVSGVATGAVAGGILGALMGFGLPKEQAQMYKERIQAGAILLAIPAHEGAEAIVKTILNDFGAQDVTSVTVPTDRIRTRDNIMLADDYEYKDTDESLRYDEPRSSAYQALGAKGGRTKRRMSRNIRNRR